MYRCIDENIYQLIGHPRRICALNKWTDEDHNDTSSSPQCCIYDSLIFIHFRIDESLINISKLLQCLRESVVSRINLRECVFKLTGIT